jgi:UDP-N-acetylglucosamine 2-epimerase
VESGLRSFNRTMPEEINRVVADHVSDLLLCPSATAVKNLAAEGLVKNVHVVGDVMLDVLRWARRKLEAKPSGILDRLGVRKGSYLLATVHRSENTDEPSRLKGILKALNAAPEMVVFPVHPRTRKAIAAQQLSTNGNLRLIDPVGYLDMVALASSARAVLTDSGGLQKEAYWLRVPCITLRDETEWVETVAMGWNRLVGADADKILEAVRTFAPGENPAALYGEGEAASKCVSLLTTIA